LHHNDVREAVCRPPHRRGAMPGRDQEEMASVPVELPVGRRRDSRPTGRTIRYGVVTAAFP
jgi:hypothetical protein